MDISRLNTEELKALADKIKAQLKDGISPADPVIEELASQVRFRAKEMNVSIEKFVAALNKALGAGKATATGTRAVSRDRVMRADFRAAGVKPYAIGTPREVLEADYITKFGQAQFDAKIAVLPIPPVVKKA